MVADEQLPPDERTLTRAAGGGRSSGEFVLPERWALDRFLARGGQAEVWLAHDRQLDELVAVKIFKPELSPASLERFRREARLGRSLQHPNLVRVFEVIEAGGRLALAMEWMPGGSAAQRLNSGPLPIDAVLRIADEALAALEYLHERQIVHRDVKPSNLLFDAQERCHLADLGLVRPLEPGATLTRGSDALGTPAYMSPEQVEGKELTPAADLYSLGATLHQLLTGRLVFEGRSDFDISHKHLEETAPDVRHARPDCPRWLARFVNRLLEKAPRDRWPNAATARRAFFRRRSLTSPRFYRRLAWRTGATVALGAMVTAAAMFVASRGTPRTVRVETGGSSVWGTDARGKETWRYSLSSPIVQVTSADLGGDGGVETVVVACPTNGPRTSHETHSQILILNRSGAIVSRLDVEDALRYWPFEYRKLVRPHVQIVDLDGDGRLDVVALCNGRDTYGSALLLFASRAREWRNLGYHAGYFWNVAGVPRVSPPRFRFVAFNNRLAMHDVVGEFELPSLVTSLPGSVHIILSLDAAMSGYQRWYTPVAFPRERTRAGDGAQFLPGLSDETQVSLWGAPLRIDRWGNPVPGPNAGRDLLAVRRGFFEWIRQLDTLSDRREREQTLRLIRETERDTARLLEESPYRAILATFAAARYSRLHLPDVAKDVLRVALAATNNEDVRYRLALLETFSGRFAVARSLVEEALPSALTPAISSRGVHLLDGLDIEDRRGTDLARRAAQFAGPRADDRDLVRGGMDAVLARARLWWDETLDSDFSVQSWDFAPEGQAIACLARWRRGRTTPSDIAEMDEFIAANPDAVFPGQLARAAALLGLGRPQEAVAALDELIATVEPRMLALESVDEFLNRQILDLARALHAKALLQAGRTQQAVTEARALRRTLRPGLLPANLVGEVLRDTGPGRRR